MNLSDDRTDRAAEVELDARSSVHVGPTGTLEVLSQIEVEKLRAGLPEVRELFRRCALAVLSTGGQSDDAAQIFREHPNFQIEVLQRTRGVKLRLERPPESAFVNGRMIEGIKEHLFAVLRDVVFIATEVNNLSRFDLTQGRHITDAVFHVLRNAGALDPDRRANQVVCWGGHAISREEYDYTKEVGYHLGLRGLDICTGCGAGAMKGPMKGAAIGHAKQRIKDARYLGITEPGIIAAEPPNPIVNHLVITPDIEKRLEAFVRVGHAIIVFPGGVGTAEEILYLLGMLLHPDNAGVQLPVFFTGPASSAGYFEHIGQLLDATVGKQARRLYQLVVDDPEGVANQAAEAARQVRRARRTTGDAFYFNWLLRIPDEFQRPFEVSHTSMASLTLKRDQPEWRLAANLRRAFSGIVTGNVKAHGVRMIRDHGPFQLQGERGVMDALDEILRRFVAERRMKIAHETYQPCYRLHGA